MEEDEEDYTPYCKHCTACGNDGCCSATMCSPDHPDCAYSHTYLEDLKDEQGYFLFAFSKLKENDFFGYKDPFEKIYDNYIKSSNKAKEFDKLKIAYRASHVVFNLLDEFNYFDKGFDYFWKDSYEEN